MACPLWAGGLGWGVSGRPVLALRSPRASRSQFRVVVVEQVGRTQLRGGPRPVQERPQLLLAAGPLPRRASPEGFPPLPPGLEPVHLLDQLERPRLVLRRGVITPERRPEVPVHLVENGAVVAGHAVEQAHDEAV